MKLKKRPSENFRRPIKYLLHSLFQYSFLVKKDIISYHYNFLTKVSQPWQSILPNFLTGWPSSCSRKTKQTSSMASCACSIPRKPPLPNCKTKPPAPTLPICPCMAKLPSAANSISNLPTPGQTFTTSCKP